MGIVTILQCRLGIIGLGDYVVSGGRVTMVDVVLLGKREQASSSG